MISQDGKRHNSVILEGIIKHDSFADITKLKSSLMLGETRRYNVVRIDVT